MFISSDLTIVGSGFCRLTTVPRTENNQLWMLSYRYSINFAFLFLVLKLILSFITLNSAYQVMDFIISLS